MMGGSQAHEFMVLNPAGEDVLVLCEACGYAANRQVAVIPKPRPARRGRRSRSRRSRRPGTTTIATLAAFLGIGPERTAKAAFFVTGDGRLVTAIVRGDYEVNETKLGQRGRRRSAASGRPRSRRSRRPGWSPATARRSARTTRSSSSTTSSRARRTSSPAPTARASTTATSTSGATSRPTSSPTSPTPRRATPARPAAQPVILRNGIEVGNIFKLGTKFTDAAGATYLGEDGVAHPIVMGSYGIGVGRNVACIVEAHHDDKGIVWPAEVAPYAAHLVSIGGGQGAAGRPRSPSASTSSRSTPAARSCGTTATSRPGVKFTDAELLGMPWILTVSPRSLAAGGVEVTERATGERSTRSIEEVEALLRGG